MELITLGTSAMVPTKTRSQTAVFLKHDTDGFLFDCGEGTQRQFQFAGIPMTKITHIFISHWHGDHTQGLTGVIQSLGANEYQKKLTIFGPEGSIKRMAALKSAYVFELKIEFEVIEVTQGKILETEKFIVEAKKLNHSVASVGYKVIEKDRRRINMDVLKKLGVPSGPHLRLLSEGKASKYRDIKLSPKECTQVIKGKQIAMIWDTKFSQDLMTFAKSCDVIVAEATFADDLKEKAAAFRHLTASQAATIAKKAKAKQLILIHFSPRYRTLDQLGSEAKAVFPNTFIAKDLDVFTL